MSVTRRVRWLFVGIVTAGSVAFVAANASFLVASAHGVGHSAPLPLAVGLALSTAAIANRGGLNRAAHQAAGLVVPPRTMIHPSAVGFTANKLVRSGGASGVAVFVRHGDARAYPHGTVLGACVLAALASFAALGSLLVFATVILVLTGQLIGWWLAAGIGLAVSSTAIVATAFAVSHWRDTVQRWWARVIARHPWLVRTLNLPSNPVDDIATAMCTARNNPRWARRTLGHALAGKALGVAMLLCAALAAGAPITLTGAVVVYATALFASMTSFIPGGVGAVEASTGAMLASLGAGIGAVAIAVALFRIFDLWIPVVAGAIGARQFSRVPRGVDPSASILAQAELVVP